MDSTNNPGNITKIYDQYDNNNKGLVNYGGYLDTTIDINTLTSLEDFCITCDSLNIRDQFVVGIDTFIVVDRSMLDSMIVGGFDVTKACVSHITDMSEVFSGRSTFNQNIGNWDMSNVP